MNNSRIHLINIIVLVSYIILFKLIYKEGAALACVFPIFIHVMVNCILFLTNISKNKSLGLHYLLSAILVLLIGFPTCLSMG